jgi:hypothetical protein
MAAPTRKTTNAKIAKRFILPPNRCFEWPVGSVEMEKD